MAVMLRTVLNLTTFRYISVNQVQQDFSSSRWQKCWSAQAQSASVLACDSRVLIRCEVVRVPVDLQVQFDPDGNMIRRLFARTDILVDLAIAQAVSRVGAQ